MQKFRLSTLALAGSLLACPLWAHGDTLTERFATDPLAQGWISTGDPNLFHWNSTNQNLEVTWDSSRSNSYFCLPLGMTITSQDDFSLAFDLNLIDSAAGVNPQKPNPFQLSLGFLNLAEANNPGFARGTGLNSPDLVEFSYFPDPGGEWLWGPSVTATFVDSIGDGFGHWSTNGFAGLALAAGDLYHVELVFAASNQTLRTSITRNGESIGPFPTAAPDADFSGFQLDHVAVMSYSDALQPIEYAGSILAHGTVDNVVLTLPPVVGALTVENNNGHWQVRFASRPQWLYTLERALQFGAWSPASASTAGDGGTMVLLDTNSPAPAAFYRVRARKL
jgi:hypothetical protein